MIVARPAGDAVEILALTRAAGSRFAPGFVVFPGGAIEPGDRELAARLFGEEEEAARACAVRELYEEAGLLLGSDGLSTCQPTLPIQGLGWAYPDPHMLVEVSRWVAPEHLEKRFDARFFATAAPAGLEPFVLSIEIENGQWARPADVLAAAERGDAPLMWPTYVMLRELERCRSVEEVLALRVEQVER